MVEGTRWFRDAARRSRLQSHDDSPTSKGRSRSAVLACALSALAVNLFGVAGWVLGWDFVTSADPGNYPIAPSAAAVGTVLSISLLLGLLESPTRGTRIGSASLLVLALVILLSALSQGFIKIGFDLEALISPDDLTYEGVDLTHMSPVASVSYLAIAVAVAASSIGMLAGKRLLRRALSWVLFGVVCLSLAMLVGYAYDAPLLYGGSFRPIALGAALSVCLLGFAATQFFREQYPHKAFVGPSVRAMLLRTFVPLSVAIVLVDGWLFTMAIRSDVSPTIFAGLVALGSAAVVGMLVDMYSQRISRRIESAESARNGALSSLKLANKKLGILGSVTRHDLLNQLTVMSGWVEVAKDSCKDDATMRSLEKACAAVISTRSQIDFMAEYESLGSKEPEWLDLRHQVMDGSIGLNLSRVRLSVEVAGWEIYADRMLNKVFRNLVSNSFMHGGDVHAITVRADVSDGSLRIVYEDDGGGVPAADKERIFERGFGKHTGYGLYLSKEILSITGISISETGVPGKGARFEMTVPEGHHRKQLDGTMDEPRHD